MGNLEKKRDWLDCALDREGTPEKKLRFIKDKLSVSNLVLESLWQAMDNERKKRERYLAELRKIKKEVRR